MSGSWFKRPAAQRKAAKSLRTGSNLIQYSLGQQGFNFYIEHFRQPFERSSLHFLLHPQVYLQINCRTDFGYEAPKKFLRTLCCRATIGHLLLRRLLEQDLVPKSAHAAVVAHASLRFMEALPAAWTMSRLRICGRMCGCGSDGRLFEPPLHGSVTSCG